jgi:hypothetical protein
LGHDAAARAQYKNGHFGDMQAPQIRPCPRHAMPTVFSCGMIAFLRMMCARAYLEQALSLNPHFSILHAGEAQRYYRLTKHSLKINHFSMDQICSIKMVPKNRYGVRPPLFPRLFSKHFLDQDVI